MPITVKGDDKLMYDPIISLIHVLLYFAFIKLILFAIKVTFIEMDYRKVSWLKRYPIVTEIFLDYDIIGWYTKIVLRCPNFPPEIAQNPVDILSIYCSYGNYCRITETRATGLSYISLVSWTNHKNCILN